MLTFKTSPDYPVFDADYYVAKLDEVLPETHQPDRFHDKPYLQLRWTWKLAVPGEAEPAKFTSWTSLSLSDKSKLPGLLAGLGVNPASFEPDEQGEVQFDSTLLIGKRCRINIEQLPGTDGKMKNRVAGYAPLPKKTPAAAAKAAKPVVPEPDEDEDDPGLPF